MRKESIPETYDDVVGLYIRDLRKSKGVSQADLGRAVGISQSVIARIENGHATTVVRLRRIAFFFGVLLSEFVDETDRRAVKAGLET